MLNYIVFVKVDLVISRNIVEQVQTVCRHTADGVSSAAENSLGNEQASGHTL